MSATFTDDKAPICIPFILERLRAHQQRQSSSISSTSSPPRPLVVGLNGIQGVGKTTLVRLLTAALESHDVPCLVCSIDDFYLPRGEQVALARSNPENALWQHRGEPGTHDIPLLRATFSSLLNHLPTSIPQYDKAAFSGQGDRLPPSLWLAINQDPNLPPLQVIILEGWCIGFRPLNPTRLLAKYESPSRTLRAHPLEHLLLINEKLAAYDAIMTDTLDALIHIDAEDLQYVYRWRIEQEEHLRRSRGGQDPERQQQAGMTDDQVVKFVDGYFPAYELFTEDLRQGMFPNAPGSQLRMIVGRDRNVKQVLEI